MSSNTPLDLDAIEALAAAAPGGAWQTDDLLEIARSVPALVAEVRRLETENAAFAKMLCDTRAFLKRAEAAEAEVVKLRAAERFNGVADLRAEVGRRQAAEAEVARLRAEVVQFQATDLALRTEIESYRKVVIWGAPEAELRAEVARLRAALAEIACCYPARASCVTCKDSDDAKRARAALDAALAGPEASDG